MKGLKRSLDGAPQACRPLPTEFFDAEHADPHDPVVRAMRGATPRQQTAPGPLLPLPVPDPYTSNSQFSRYNHQDLAATSRDELLCEMIFSAVASRTSDSPWWCQRWNATVTEWRKRRDPR